MTTTRARWLPLRVKGGWNPVLRTAFTRRSGVYAVRDARSRAVLYVGESHTDRGWTTLTRHFQDPSGAFAVRNEFTRATADGLEAALWVTPAGQPAIDLQADKIKRLRPRHNRHHGKTTAPTKPRRRRAVKPVTDADFPFGALAPKANPEHPEDTYRRTHWGEAGSWAWRELHAARPSLVGARRVGPIRAIAYRTRKGGDRRATTYEHEFAPAAQPTLYTRRDGWIVSGGRYTVTTHGIEDARAECPRAPRPDASPLVELGALVDVTIATGDRVRPPRGAVLAHNAAGLIAAFADERIDHQPSNEAAP